MDFIIAIDEKAMWHNMISNAAVTDKGAKSVVLKTAGYGKSKVTVPLAAKANGDKLKPYIVFPGHKPEVQKLKKDPAIKSFLCVINHKWFIEWEYNHRLGWEYF